jgi:hypothetical protein
MKSACISWITLLLVAAGCSSDDAPGDPPDAAALDAAALDAAARDAATLDAAARDAAPPDATAPDAGPIDCADLFLPARVDSVVMGSRPASDNVDDVVTWQDGEDVQLVYGGQGTIMLFSEVVARGSGLTPEFMDYFLAAVVSPSGDEQRRNRYTNFVVAAEDGSWRWERVVVEFEEIFPEDGGTLDVILRIGCLEIQRTITVHFPTEPPPDEP